jgi:molybdate transport system substrate-binding protein
MMKSMFVIVMSLFFLGSLAVNGYAAEQTLVVSAATSLQDSFLEAGKIFESDHPGTRIAFNFASSNQLANQIEQGAPVDIFASADMSILNRLAGNNIITENSVMAKNKLTVIVSKNSSMKIEGLADLAKKGVRLIIAGNQVPAGRYARQFLQKADQAGSYGTDYNSLVLGNIVSEEPDLRMVAMKVAFGEGDAGIVYVSDITGDVGNKVRAIAIPDQLNVIAAYGIAIVKSSAHPEAAKEFYSLLLSPKGQAILTKNGLLPAQTK